MSKKEQANSDTVQSTSPPDHTQQPFLRPLEYVHLTILHKLQNAVSVGGREDYGG